MLVVLGLLVFNLAYAQQEFTKADARGLIDTFFEGFHKGDTLLMRSVLGRDVPLQTAYTDGQGIPLVHNSGIDVLLAGIADRPKDQKWEERLLDYRIELDGNLAHVWTPYQFWLNGTLSHCGANAFTLAKTTAGWKIIHLIDSRRREGCRD
jgi:hypothetical protein